MVVVKGVKADSDQTHILIHPDLATSGLKGSAIKREVLSRTVLPRDSGTQHLPSGTHKLS